MALAFRIEDAIALSSVPGIVLIGPEVAAGVIGVGDDLAVPTSEGELVCRCLEIPLIRLGSDRADWVRVSISGVDSSLVARGGIARVC